MTVAEKILRAKDDYDAVYESGYAKGQAEGGGGSYDQGFSDGKQEAYDAFWDAYQDNGNREEYSHAFGGIGWNNRTFKPKYDIKPNSSYMMFRQFAFDGDLVDCLDNLGVTLDFSNSTNTVYIFALAPKITHIGEIDARNSTSSTVFDMCFQNCSALKTIDKLKFKKGTTGEFGASSFLNCTALENITMEGEIANNGLNLRYSPKLSRKSIESIVGCLSDNVSGKTITLSKTAVVAFDSEITAIPFSFTAVTEGANVTGVDNGDGTATFNGTIELDTDFSYGNATDVFSAGSYAILFPGTNRYDFYVRLYDLDGNLIAEYTYWNTPGGVQTFTVDKDFVMKCKLYVTGSYTFNNEVIAYPTIRPDFETLKATKPNWTITEV